MARPVMKTLSDVAAAMTDLSQETLSPTPLTMGEEGGPLGGPQTPFQPSNVLGDKEEEIMEYLCSEIRDVRDGADRKTLLLKWDKWRKQRLAVPDSESRDLPWIKSSNVVPPLTMQKVQTVFAKLIAAFATKKPPVAVVPINPADTDTAEALERWYRGMADDKYGLDVRRKFKQIAYEVVSMGTQVVKVPFKYESWAFKRTVGGATQTVQYVRQKGPTIVPIRLEDFFTRPYWKDVQRAPWCGVRYRYFYHELKQMQGQGFFSDVDKILGQALTQYDDNLQAELERTGVDTSSLGKETANQEFEVYECYVFWDLDNDGIPEDLILWVEPDTGTLLRAEYNPLSVRDIEVGTYLDDPDSLFGIGICRMVEGPQETLTALQRMRLDGTKLNMLKMFLARRGAGIGPDETLEPFKILFVDDPLSDFRPIEFPDISQGCLIGEQMAKEDADRVSGANDYMAGFNDKIVGSNATSSGMQYLGSQANSILNSLLENIEQFMTNVYMIVLYQAIANKDLVDLSWLSEEDQTLVRSVLDMNVEDLPTKFRFSVRTTDINRTDESRKQNYMMAMQLYNQYFQSAMGIVQMKSNPQVQGNADIQDLLTSTYVGLTTLTDKMLEFFDIGDPKDFLPFIEQYKVQMRASDKVREAQAQAMRGAMNGNQGTGIQEAGFGGAGFPGAFGGALAGAGAVPGMPLTPEMGGAGGGGSAMPGNTAPGAGPVAG